MNRQLRGVSTVIVLMFVALFVSTTSIQFFSAEQLRADPRNSRTILASYSTKRGAILVDGSPIAESSPSNDQYQYQRKYTNGDLYSAVTGYFTIGQGNSGIESAENGVLSGNSDASFFQNLNAILTGQDVQGDNVNLTIDPDVQKAAYDALGSNTGAVVAIQPKTGKILAMVSKESYDPNVLTSHDTADVVAKYKALEQAAGQPLKNRAIAGDLYTPGSVFKLIVASAALEGGKYTLDSTFPTRRGCSSRARARTSTTPRAARAEAATRSSSARRSSTRATSRSRSSDRSSATTRSRAWRTSTASATRSRSR